MSARPTALVTGASRGIGLELARLLAADGHDLVLLARSEGPMRALAQELTESHGVAVRIELADLSDPAAPGAVVSRLEADGVAIDVLVNNAGFGSTGAFHTLDLATELRQVQVNVGALTALTGLLLPGMVRRGRGRVLNIASTAAFQPGPFMAVYFATKSYVLSFTEAIAFELKGTGVSATAHCPGATETGFAARAGNDKNKLFTKQKPAGAAVVAADAYRAMCAGKVVRIHGAANWVGAFSVRFSPRWAVPYVAASLNQP